MKVEQRKILYPFGIWLIFIVLAIINGTVREIIYGQKLGAHMGHVISTIILIFAIFIVVYLFITRIKVIYTRDELVLMGVFWVFITVIFEFVFGHYVMGNPWEILLADYNIFKGRLFGLVLLGVLVAPSITDRILNKQQ